MGKYRDIVAELREPHGGTAVRDPGSVGRLRQAPRGGSGRRRVGRQDEGADGAGHRGGQAVTDASPTTRVAPGGAGATRAEVAEALGVALLMDGGTATVYGPRAMVAFDEFAAPVGTAS